MRPAWKYSLIPVAVGLSSLFALLPHDGGDATVRIVARDGGFAYEPSTVRIQPGQRVAFVNDTKQTHTASCDGCPWTTGDIQPSQTRFVTYPDEMASTFSCRYHADQPGLRGTLVVGSPPAEASPSASPVPTAVPSPAGSPGS